jgi:MFS family permease
VTRASLRTLAWRVVLLYLALRAVTTVLLVVASRDQVVMPDWTGPTVEPLDMTVLWDGSWYRHVALNGYPTELPVNGDSGRVAQNAWAFYPVFPLVSRALMSATGLGFPVVASALALACGLGAAVLMAGLLAERVGERVALATVAVWAAFPAAVSLQLAYTESAAMLVLCAALWALLRRQWVLVGALGLLLGLTRPVTAPLVAVVAVALLVRWVHRRRSPIGWGEYLGGAFALAGTALGAVAWPLVAWYVTGSRTAYTDTMAAWRAGNEIVPLKPWWGMSKWAARDLPHPDVLGPVGLAALAVGIVVLTVGPWASALGPELRAWCLAYPAYLAVVLDPFTSIFRYALPLFPLVAVALGGGWARRSARWLWARAWLLVAAGTVGQVAWIWKLLVYHPPSDYPP